jgi:hypothetical protein
MFLGKVCLWMDCNMLVYPKILQMEKEAFGFHIFLRVGGIIYDL